MKRFITLILYHPDGPQWGWWRKNKRRAILVVDTHKIDGTVDLSDVFNYYWKEPLVERRYLSLDARGKTERSGYQRILKHAHAVAEALNSGIQPPPEDDIKDVIPEGIATYYQS